MKKLWVMVVFLVLSCNSADKKAEQIAIQFLDAYFKIDYNTAAGFCSTELAEELGSSLKSIESLEDGIRDMIIKQTSELKTQIVSVDSESRKDTVIVAYKVLLPDFPNGIENKLLLSKIEKEWKIVELGIR